MTNSAADLLNADKIASYLKSGQQGDLGKIEIFSCIDSTNLEAMRRLKSGYSGSLLLLAEAQTNGRGRRGRSWVSKAGSGVYLSLVWPVENDPAALQALSLVTALSLQACLQQAGVSGSGLKWPNDILIDSKKVAGILLEFYCHKNGLSHLIVGVGINISDARQISQQIEQAVTDLSSNAVSQIDRNEIAGRFMAQLIPMLKQFAVSGFSAFVEQWNGQDVFYGKEVVVKHGETRLVGIARGVDETGALLLDSTQGRRRIVGGELSPSVRLNTASERE